MLTFNDIITNEILANGFARGTVPLRDYIINGSFKYWLDNTGLSAGKGLRYTATLFKLFSITNTQAVTRNLNVLGQTSVPTSSPYYATITTTDASGASDASVAILQMEDVRKYSNTTQTFSIWASASSGTPKIAIEAQQWFGTDSMSSPVTGISVTTINLSTTITRYDVKIDWPSISGKYLGTASRSQIYIWFSAGSNFNSRTNSLGHQAVTVNIYKMQLVDGPVYQYVPERSENEELALIGRYYYSFSELPYSARVSFNGTASDSTHLLAPVRLPQQMRAAPTVTAVGNWRSLPGGVPVIMSFSERTSYSFLISVTTSGWTTGQSCIIQTQDGSGNGLVADARF